MDKDILDKKALAASIAIFALKFLQIEKNIYHQHDIFAVADHTFAIKKEKTANNVLDKKAFTTSIPATGTIALAI